MKYSVIANDNKMWKPEKYSTILATTLPSDVKRASNPSVVGSCDRPEGFLPQEHHLLNTDGEIAVNYKGLIALHLFEQNYEYLSAW